MPSVRRTTAASAAVRPLPALGAAVIATLAVALAAAAQASPAPTAGSDVASSFVRPFEYTLPADWEPTVVLQKVPLLMLAEADPGGGFGDLQRSGLRGVLVADVTGGWVHPCPGVDGGGREQVGGGAGGFLTDMQAVAGLDFEDLSVTRLDGQRAIAAMNVSSSRCGAGDIHLPGLPSFEDYIDLDVPSHLVLAEVDGRTILVQAWAGTEYDLEEWLPIAQEFIDSIHFVEQGDSAAASAPASSPST